MQILSYEVSTVRGQGHPGEQIAIVASAQRVQHTDGTPWGTLIAAHNVTALARSLMVKDEFLTTVSHELRTPLTSILGYLELLHDELDPGQGFVADTLTTIERNATRLQQRVQQLLDTADQRRDLDLESCDLSVLAHRVHDTFAAAAVEADIDFAVRAASGHLATMDSGQVEQAVENLVSNALKFTGPGGTAVLSVDGAEQSVTITVTDDGIGMSSDEAAQACDTFWRAERATKDAVDGFGVGLRLVTDIVEAHRGSLDIDSQPEQGTTVTITFPRDGVVVRGKERAHRRAVRLMRDVKLSQAH